LPNHLPVPIVLSGTERGGAVAEIRITNRKELEAWLQDKPRQWAIAIAVRAALRVVPLWGEYLKPQLFLKTAEADRFMLMLFRCVAVSRLAVVMPKRDLRAAAAFRSAGTFRSAAEATAGYSGFKSTAAVAAGAARWSSDATASPRLDTCRTAAAAATDSAVSAAPTNWFAISSDISALASGLSSAIDGPLWRNINIHAGAAAIVADLVVPDWVVARLDLFRNDLLALGKHWAIWLNWYDAVLNGNQPWGLPHKAGNEVMYDLLTMYEGAWENSPEWINARLKALVEEALARVAAEQPEPPPLETIPSQEPTAYRFDGAADAPITLAVPAEPSDKLIATPERREDYLDIRAKAEAIKAEGRNRCGHLLPPIDRFLELSPDLAAVRAQAFWSRMNTLRLKLDGHEASIALEQRTGDGDERKLDAVVADLMVDLVQTVNAFVLGDQQLLDRDAARPGPQETQQAQFEQNILAPVIAVAAKDAALTDKAAADVITEEFAKMGSAGGSLAERQGADFGRRTIRNYVTEVLRRAWNAVRPNIKEGSPSISGEVRSGALREVGATLTRGTIGLVKEYWPTLLGGAGSFVYFVAQNGTALIAYAQSAFNNPQLVEIIRRIMRFGG
jgi:hypothetical protein